MTIDPEDSVQLEPDSAATESGLANELSGGVPLEAEPADVLEQKQSLDIDDDDYRDSEASGEDDYRDT